MANRKKNLKAKKQDKETIQNDNILSDKIFNIITVFFIVSVVLLSFYLVTLIIVGNPNKKTKPIVNFDYKEILAGSSFDKNDNEYYVVYYDFSESDFSDLAYAVNEYENQHETNKIYLVNLKEGLNKKYITSKDSNKKPSSASELAINGPTLIHFKDKKINSYVEGKDDIISYLK